MKDKDYYMDRVAKSRSSKKSGHAGEHESKDSVKGNAYEPSSSRKSALGKLMSDEGAISQKIKSTGSEKFDKRDLEDKNGDNTADRHRKRIRREIRDKMLNKK